MKSRDYPLIVARDLETLLKQLRRVATENSDLLNMVESTDGKVAINDLSASSTFHFTVSPPTIQHDNKYSFPVTYKPTNSASLKSTSILLPAIDIIKYLIQWLDFLKEYNNISFEKHDEFLHAYEKEFADAFEIIDEDADINPFDLRRQLLLSGALDKIVEGLENHKSLYDVAPLIEEAKQLNKEISTSTKKVVIRKLGKILAKMRSIGIELFKDVMKDYAKDIIQSGINNGWHLFTNHYHLFK